MSEIEIRDALALIMALRGNIAGSEEDWEQMHPEDKMFVYMDADSAIHWMKTNPEKVAFLLAEESPE